MLRRSALLALPAFLAGIGGATVLWGNQAAAIDAQPALVAGANVQAAAPAAIVEAADAVPVVAPPAAAPGTRSKVIKEVLPSSVRIQLLREGSVSRAASGVVIGFRKEAEGHVGYVITNTHVVETKDPEGTTIQVLVDRKGKTSSYAARVVALGEVPDMDLALLEVPDLVGRAAELVSDSDLELGDDVVAVGAPFGRGLSISSGIVSQLDWDDAGAAQAFKTDAPIGYGASGGGIFRVPDGKLLAVIEGYRTAKVSIPMAEKSYSFDVPMPGETFAAPAAKVRRFLKSRGVAHLVAGLFPGEKLEAKPAVETAAR
ncbi:trypsin-like peptidase domain-containing protein [Vulgatibacter sp.]|uniref:trypsin-like peptidase domain-containing protein n=1 Tax=Vulgatibacter sp. TaxID=1971226 RepID=UPI003561F0FB